MLSSSQLKWPFNFPCTCVSYLPFPLKLTHLWNQTKNMTNTHQVFPASFWKFTSAPWLTKISITLKKRERKTVNVSCGYFQIKYGRPSITHSDAEIITARKRSLGQGNIFRSVCQEFCPRGGGGGAWGVSQHPLQVVSQHTLQVSGGGGGIPACLAGIQGGSGIPAYLAGLQVHTKGGSWGVWPGGGLKAHTQGEGAGGILACTEADTPPTAGYCCRRYASYWNAFLLHNVFIVFRHYT